MKGMGSCGIWPSSFMRCSSWCAGQRLRRVDPAALMGSPGDDGGPSALLAYADEALFEAEQDEEAPVPPGERAVLQEWVRKLVAALWAARR